MLSKLFFFLTKFSFYSRPTINRNETETDKVWSGVEKRVFLDVFSKVLTQACSSCDLGVVQEWPRSIAVLRDVAVPLKQGSSCQSAIKLDHSDDNKPRRLPSRVESVYWVSAIRQLLIDNIFMLCNVGTTWMRIW